MNETYHLKLKIPTDETSAKVSLESWLPPDFGGRLSMRQLDRDSAVALLATIHSYFDGRQ